MPEVGSGRAPPRPALKAVGYVKFVFEPSGSPFTNRQSSSIETLSRGNSAPITPRPNTTATPTITIHTHPTDNASRCPTLIRKPRALSPHLLKSYRPHDKNDIPFRPRRKLASLLIAIRQ